MKILIFFEKQNMLKMSGIGRALRHQKMALEANKIPYTLDKKDTYDIAHINTNFFESYRLLKKCHKMNIPVIVHGHSTKEDFRQSFRFWQLIKYIFYPNLLRMYKHADLIITPTIYSKHLIENYKGVKCPVVNISNGINLQEYSHSEEKINKFKQFFKLSKDDKVVIGIGLFFERKGLLDFFEVAKSMPDVKFIWFGKINPILIPHKINHAIKHRPNNVLMPGYIDGDIIKGALQGATCMFFPSYEETEGIVVLEALASNLPLLIRDIGVYEDWLTDGVNCYKGKNNEEFIDKLKYIFNNNMNQVIKNGKEVVKARSIDIVGKQLVDTYAELNKNKK